MSKFKRVISSITMMIMLVTMLSVPAFATDVDSDITDTSSDTLNSAQTTWLESNIISVSDSGTITAKQAWIATYLTTDESQAAKDSAGNPVMLSSSLSGVSTTIYLRSGKTEKGLAQQIATNSNNEKTVENVSNITNGLNISADTQSAAAMMTGFAPIISLILGIMVTLITIGMTLFSAFDICYIAFPVFRNKCEDAKVSGGNSMMTKKSANGGTTLRFVTDDAQYAVSQGTIENGKSPWWIYFKKRILSYILLAIILFILLTGNISLITNIALRLVSGIMNVLGGLG